MLERSVRRRKQWKYLAMWQSTVELMQFMSRVLQSISKQTTEKHQHRYTSVKADSIWVDRLKTASREEVVSVTSIINCCLNLKFILW